MSYFGFGIGFTLNLSKGQLFHNFLFVAALVISFTTARPVSAATLTVNSKADTAANDGTCTLREAITAANSNTSSGAAAGECSAGTSGTDTINFSIAGTADFTIESQSGYTIKPTSSLPNIAETLVINGYSQAGSRANTTVSPRPFNSVLLIEIDGSDAGASVDGFSIDPAATGVTLRGLVINSFFRGVGGNGGGSGAIVQGNYIGTSPNGLVDKGNTDQGMQLGPNAKIGGLLPSERNILSGNDSGGASPNTGDNNWVIQGNYVGLGADGKTSIPNSAPGGNGAFSIDNSNGHLVGGTEEGATNVISGNRSFAIFPDYNSNVKIQGNIIGPDWEGKPLAVNQQQGGIGLPPMNGSMNDFMIGGLEERAPNTIAHNNGPGIVIADTHNNGVVGNRSTNISILRNKIYNNGTNNGSQLSTAGLGIDHARINTSNLTVSNLGVTANDAGDGDTGPNEFINFPVISKVSSSDGSASITYSLDINNAEVGATGYRVEFYANDAADPSGHGEGQTFIGADTIPGDVTNRSFSFALPSGVSGAQYITATTTSTDISSDGFGQTSEFSAQLLATLYATGSGLTLADTGASVTPILITAGVLIGGSILVLQSRRLYYTTSSK